VLYWIQGNKKLKPFVQHHINEIQQTTQKFEVTWHFCLTADNPAGIITRGSSTCQLISSSLWNKGPLWLTNDNDWPQWTPSKTFHLHVAVVPCEEFIPESSEHLSPSPTINLHKVIDPKNDSNLGKLLRVSTYVHRFITNIRKCNNRQCDQLTVTETDIARIQWIKTANIRFTQMKFPSSAPNAPVVNVLH